VIGETMNNLVVLLNDCISLVDEIYDTALKEDLNQARNKSSLLINKLNALFPLLLETELQIKPDFIEKVEKLIAANEVGDGIGIMDIVGFEIKSILVDYLESIGETFERK
jgi:hypothetical protein